MRLPAQHLLALALAGCLAAAQGFSWKQCGEGGFAVKDVALTPEPVQPGSTAVFKISADAGVEVQEGTVNMLVTYVGIPIWTQSDNLCDKTACPVAKGPVDVVYKQLFPIITPPGQYVVTLRGLTGTDLLFCVEVTFQVVPPQSAGAVVLQLAADRVLPAHRKQLV